MIDHDTPQMDAARVAEIDGMLRTVVRREAARRPRSKRTMLAWLALPVLAGSVIVAAGVSAPKTAPITNTVEVACFTRADYIGTDGTIPGTYQSVMTGAPGERDDNGYTPVQDISIPANAMAACTSLWADGSLSSKVGNNFMPGTPPGGGTVPAELTLCVLPNGAGAVIPAMPGCATGWGSPRRAAPDSLSCSTRA